ncbi:MAG: ABC transporter permease [Alphaproteobacteria bacterium]|nr:ABC transporter permease [Alphaproteobacteria bacterium]
MTGGLGRKGWLLLPAVGFVTLFVAAPLLMTLQRSLLYQGALPSAGNYARLFGDWFYIETALHTLALSGAATLITLVIGYPLAYLIARSGGWRKSLLIFLVVTPLLTNVVVRTFGWMIIFGRSGLLNSLLAAIGLPGLDLAHSWTAIAIALVHVMLPFMVLSIASKLQTLDPNLEHAAATLGASRLRQFRHVVIPLSRDGILTGCTLVFCLCMGSFVTVMLMGDNSTLVLPILIYQQLTVASDWPLAASIGIVLTATVVAFLAVQSSLIGAER